MKTGLIFAWFVLATVSGFAQGTVSFANDSNTRVCLYPGDRWVPRGSTFQAELMFAPDGTPLDLFESVAVRLGLPTTFNVPVSDGLFNGGPRTAPTSTPGGFGLFEVRVWESAFGSSYAHVAATGQGQIGKSEILRVDTADPTTIPPGTPASLVTAGLRTFLVAPAVVAECTIPEPSVYALGVLGAGVFWVLRRRRR